MRARVALSLVVLLCGACGQGSATGEDLAVGGDAAATPDLATGDLTLPPDLAPAPFVIAPGTTRVLTKTIDVPGTGRQAILYAPAFAYDKTKAWLLVVNDGQDATALGLALTLDDLWGKQLLPPLVVAALPVSPGGDRLQDYGTAEHDVTIPCDPDGTGSLLGTRAAAYGRYVIDRVIPAAAQAVDFTPAPARTGLLGASLGGLSAMAIAWDHPEVFGFAGAMSGSFWWRTMAGTVEQRQSSRILRNVVGRAAPHPGFRAWFEAGTLDETADRDGNGVIDAIDDTLDLMAALRKAGLQDGVDLAYDQVQGGVHGYATWAAVLPVFLRWATGT